MNERDGNGSQGFFGFSGRFRLKSDSKGRLTLPSFCRRALPVEEEQWLVMRRGGESYVQVIPLHEWQRIEARQRGGQAAARGPERQWQLRLQSSSVAHSCLDQKGRVTVPQDLLEHAGIAGEVLVLGVGRHMELWDPDTFFAQAAKHADDGNQIDDLLFD